MKALPEFQLPDQDGKIFSSTQLYGKPAVIFFYPRDNTPGCIAEACAFRDAYEDFTDLGAAVVGISSDSSQSHKAFASRYKLPFTLLADKDGFVRKIFQVNRTLFNLLPGRETFVFDARGQLIMRYNSINSDKHMRKALDALKN